MKIKVEFYITYITTPFLGLSIILMLKKKDHNEREKIKVSISSRLSSWSFNSPSFINTMTMVIDVK